MKKLAVAGVGMLLMATAWVTTLHKGPECSGQPDRECTPGVVDSKITKADLCPHLGPSVVRNVSASVKAEVKKEYGVVNFHGEIDHLISLELGGSNDIKNLWPQPGPIPNAKDKLENKLHAQVCSGQITLKYAQEKIRTATP